MEHNVQTLTTHEQKETIIGIQSFLEMINKS
jgi:hypothetical protein